MYNNETMSRRSQEITSFKQTGKRLSRSQSNSASARPRTRSATPILSQAANKVSRKRDISKQAAYHADAESRNGPSETRSGHAQEKNCRYWAEKKWKPRLELVGGPLLLVRHLRNISWMAHAVGFNALSESCILHETQASQTQGEL